MGKGVEPSAGTLEPGVFYDGRPVEHLLFLSVGFQAVVGAGPDAVFLTDFALALPGAAAGAVALIFDALRFGA